MTESETRSSAPTDDPNSTSDRHQSHSGRTSSVSRQASKGRGDAVSTMKRKSSLSPSKQSEDTYVSEDEALPIKKARSRMSASGSRQKAHDVVEGKETSMEATRHARRSEEDTGGGHGSEGDSGVEDGPGKKEKRRLANRKNAQLSRDRKKKFIETLMKENAELMHNAAILEELPDLILVVDLEGTIEYASKAARTMLYRHEDSVMGSPIFGIMDQESADEFRQTFSTKVRQIDALHGDMESIRCTNVATPWKMTVQLMKEDSTTVLCLLSASVATIEIATPMAPEDISPNGEIEGIVDEQPRFLCSIRPVD